MLDITTVTLQDVNTSYKLTHITREMHGTKEWLELLNIGVTRSVEINANAWFAWSCLCFSRIKARVLFCSASSSVGQIFHLEWRL